MNGLNHISGRLVNEDILVTGGSGAIGSRLVRRLLLEDVKSVYIIDDLSSGYEWLLPNDARVQFIEGDVSSILEMGIAIGSPYIFHLAAFFANQNSVDYPLADLQTNGKGTLATLMWARDNKAKRFVYASAGCSIAGHNIDAPIREDMPVSLHLDTPYQITKALGEFYCNYFNQFVSTVRCRFFNSFGPGEVPGHYRNVIPKFIWLALNGEPLIITGTGQETRDFIYVDDLVDGLIRAAITPDADGKAFNLGTGIQTKIIDLAEMIIEFSRSNSEIVFAPRRPWDNSVRRQADISQAKKILDFNPQFLLREGLEQTVNWFLENRDKIGASAEN